ncbi:MAG: DNA repair protein RecO [Motiliproteus sp.]|nr:DNA repair protein RecO [Motiliproteus sp.]MCW9050711.1 DNA repair protein RecO [Motiliproteus sp.]
MTTSSNRVEGQPAYVLHTIPYKDTSNLVDYISRDYGRVRMVVKGGRRSGSRLRDGLQPFQPLQISWQGKGELKNLISAETVSVNPFLQGRSLWCGLYLNELVQRLLPSWEAFPRLFAYYQLTVSSLSDSDSIEPVLRIFERRLIEELGFGVSFSHCGDNGERIDAQCYYQFDPQRGFIRADSSGQLPSYSGVSILAIGADDYQLAQTCRYAKRLMRAALAPQLEGKPLKSRALFQTESPSPTENKNYHWNTAKE